ncbi:MAG: hypothetical protein KJO55_07470, partial [Gammaproteobacteria bacterium]|nr:hypothetical protein [Gammaproteobacteria bacterium]
MSTTRLYTLCYWALFLAVLANIDLGLNVAGIPVNIQRLVFLLVVACIIVGAGQLRLSRPALPFYCIAPLACYGALLALELFHNIRLQRFDAVVVVYFFTLLLIVVTCYLREYSAQKSHPTLVALVVAGVIATTGLSSLDFATITHSLSLDGDFYDSMRLRSTDTRNIINTWAAAVVIAFTFVSDLA